MLEIFFLYFCQYRLGLRANCGHHRRFYLRSICLNFHVLVSNIFLINNTITFSTDYSFSVQIVLEEQSFPRNSKGELKVAEIGGIVA